MEKNRPEASLVRRFYIYQKERFPLLFNGVMISAFTFSAVSYSRICRDEQGFIGWSNFIPGIFITVTFFLLVRIFDEFKDKDDDAKYRSYLPVPRGLVTLQELKILAAIVILFQMIVVFAFQPSMFGLYAMAFGYLALMAVEFFVPAWLRSRQMIYVTSHMFIIPLVDLYASGLDWKLSEVTPPAGLLWFFAVSYANGLVLEFGRKIRTPETEEEGVLSYTGLYGLKGGILLWISVLTLTYILALAAANYAGFSKAAYLGFTLVYAICLLPAVLFFFSPRPGFTKGVEYASAAWTVLMYLLLGAVPMIQQLTG